MAGEEIEASPSHHSVSDNGQGPSTASISAIVHRWKWWFMVAINIALLLIGQSGAVILGKFYFDQGGKSLWMATLVQSVAFPVLFLPYFFFPRPQNLPIQSSFQTLTIAYFFLGILLAGDSLMYSYGLLYLPVSTYSLICASQLGFNAVFSFFINSQKITLLILNSVILLTVSASLIAAHSDEKTRKFSSREFIIGFICTIGASAGYALWLSLMQLTIEKLLKRETFWVVLEIQIWTCLVASIVCLVGLFAGGEVKGLREEIEGFERGKAGYVLTLVGTALCWQVCSVGVVGLIYVVSSLFSNIVSMMSLPLVPLAAVVLYHENMEAVKVVALLLAILSFASYIYQNYLDQNKLKQQEVQSV
ncbi:probable purine permease 11 [Neltuma alba]|uniref:probable purine permease 11 n=1 Tax=Neltuma alba TaxID=207710 RepID=UPI0010A3A401|nr:probable purine permease 11 [Prosopis alba]